MNVRLNTNHGPLHQKYMVQIFETINRALHEHPRSIAIRVDLRLPVNKGCHDNPSNFSRTDSKVISRFFDSLNSKIKADLRMRKRAGVRAHPCSLRYVWVKEKNREHKDHYHALLLLNYDTYRFLGDYRSSQSSLSTKICLAWISALGESSEEYIPLVHFPKNPVYYLVRSEQNEKLSEEMQELIYRVSYLAKKRTKQYGDSFHSFGCSRR